MICERLASAKFPWYNRSMLTKNLPMDEPRKRGGAPRRAMFAKMVSVRLTPKQVEWVQKLEEEFQCDGAEVMRRGLTELARRHGLNGDKEKEN